MSEHPSFTIAVYAFVRSLVVRFVNSYELDIEDAGIYHLLHSIFSVFTSKTQKHTILKAILNDEFEEDAIEEYPVELIVALERLFISSGCFFVISANKISQIISSMASTSASSVRKSFKYDVFLSFRGEDTRNSFVGHLYKALEQNGIETYKDDEKIKKGETIDNELIKSIEDSRFLVIVFSTNYASSSWCLDELVKIMECQKTAEQTAYPVFYDVDPTEVRKQSGLVREAFTKHEHEEAAGKWREALKEAADLAGWELKKTADG
ncbi:Toll/interleukin-1 receptor domain-containing protein [Tanacetum coccineum]